MSNGKMKELYMLLCKHDWTFTFSDDGNVYARGREEQKAIETLVEEVGPNGERLYQAFRDTKYNPATGFPW